MTLPTATRTWTISANNRVAYGAGVGTCLGNYFYSIKTFLKAHGYTVKGSCSADTGAMDGVDRWASGADFTPRGANPTTSQAWIVLVDASGVNILIAWQGADDYNCKIAMSATGSYIAAGIPNQQPTATDEQIFSSTSSIQHVGNVVAGDRVWHGWVDSESKSFRIACYSLGLPLVCWGVELMSSGVSGTAVFSPATWAFLYAGGTSASQLSESQSTSYGGMARVVVSGVERLLLVGGTMEVNNTNNPTNFSNRMSLNDYQYPIVPVGSHSTTAGGKGFLGWRYDWWGSGLSSALGGYAFVGMTLIAVMGAIVWPWDGATIPLRS